MSEPGGAPQRLLHLTDTHLFADPDALLADVNVHRRFRAVLAALADQSGAAALLHSGDLSHDGSAVAYQRLKAALDSLGLPGRVVPGNHDRRDAMDTAFASGLVTASRSLRLDHWRVITLDSHVPDQVHGWLDDAELRALDACLTDDPDAHVLIMLHHQPVAVGTLWLDAIGLKNPEPLLERIAANPKIRGVVFGHVHHEVGLHINGCPFLATPATAAQFRGGALTFTVDPSAPGYRWIDLHPDGQLSTGVTFVRAD